MEEIHSKIEEIDGKVAQIISDKLWNGEITEAEVEEYRTNLREKLLKEMPEELKYENEVLKLEIEKDLMQQQKDAIDIERKRMESELEEYERTSYERIWAKGELYRDVSRIHPDRTMDQYKRDANRAISDIKQMSEEQRRDKNMAFDKTMNKMGELGKNIALSELAKHISTEERKAFDSFLNGSNGQVDLMELMKQMPETMKGYLEAGNYHINSALDGVDKKADVLHHISDSMFHDGNTYQQTILEAEENKRKIIGIGEIKEATENVRKPEIDTELAAIKRERTQEKEERE